MSVAHAPPAGLARSWQAQAMERERATGPVGPRTREGVTSGRSWGDKNTRRHAAPGHCPPAPRSSRYNGKAARTGPFQSRVAAANSGRCHLLLAAEEEVQLARATAVGLTTNHSRQRSLGWIVAAWSLSKL